MDQIPILIVEDNLTNLKLARVTLQIEGYLVKTAVNADEAMQVLSTFKPRIILMDIQLPKVDGLELTRMLKANPSFKDIIIIAMTAYAMKGDREKMLAAGCDDYLAKPINIHHFINIIAKHLKSKPVDELQ